MQLHYLWAHALGLNPPARCHPQALQACSSARSHLLVRLSAEPLAVGAPLTLSSGTKLFGVGFFASLLGVGITNGLMMARQMLDPTFVPLNPPQVSGRNVCCEVPMAVVASGPASSNPLMRFAPVCLAPRQHDLLPSHADPLHLLPTAAQDVLVMSAAYGSYMASSSNLRYQVRLPCACLALSHHAWSMRCRLSARPSASLLAPGPPHAHTYLRPVTPPLHSPSHSPLPCPDPGWPG